MICNVSKTMHRLLPALLLSYLVAAIPTAEATTADQGAAGDWLTRYAGARTVGLGGAFVAVADEAVGTLWNPAGLRWLHRNEVQFGTVRLFDDTAINNLSLALPLGERISAGVSMFALRSGDFEQTNELNEVLGDFDVADTAFLFSMAYGLSPRLAIGANMKVLRQTIEDYNDTGTGFDLGAQFAVTDALRLGAALQNIGGPSLKLRERTEDVPTELRAGAALKIFDHAGLLTAEVAHRGEDWGTLLRVGGEVWLMSRLALRVGYADESIAGGASFRLPQGWQFDWGMSDHELGIVHRVGLSMRFGGFQATSQATPEVFSPIGSQPVTKFVLRARTKSEAADWQLLISDKSGFAVRTFGGRGSPPAHVLWDGKDGAGLPLPDGVYTYRLTVHDDAGREFAGQDRRVEINTGGPAITVPVVVH